MIIIFKFSSDPAEMSNDKSYKVIQIINYLGMNINGVFGQMTNFIIRKLGHITEYFILYMVLINAFKNDFALKKNIILSFLITFLYACSDEVHQLFVPGRSGKVVDVCIDMFGAIVALIFIAIYTNKIKIKNSRTNE